jgi:hypothetical protein
MFAFEWCKSSYARSASLRAGLRRNELSFLRYYGTAKAVP